MTSTFKYNAKVAKLPVDDQLVHSISREFHLVKESIMLICNGRLVEVQEDGRLPTASIPVDHEIKVKGDEDEGTTDSADTKAVVTFTEEDCAKLIAETTANTNTVDVAFLNKSIQAGQHLWNMATFSAATIDTRLVVPEKSNINTFLKVALVQLSQLIEIAFRESTDAMTSMTINLSIVPNAFDSIFDAYVNPDAGTLTILKANIDSIKTVTKKCVTVISGTVDKFSPANKFIKDLIDVLVATAKKEKVEYAESIKRLGKYEAERDKLKSERRRVHANLEAQVKSASDAYDKWQKKFDENSDLAHELALNVVPVTAEALYLARDMLALYYGVPLVDNNKVNRVFDDKETIRSNLQKGEEIARETYEEQQTALNQLHIENQQSASDLAALVAKVENSKKDKLEIDELINEIVNLTKTLNDIQQNWEDLLDFFKSLDQVTSGPLTNALTSYEKLTESSDDTVKASTLKEVLSGCLRAVSLSISARQAAIVYNKVFRGFIEPYLNVAGRLQMEQRQAKNELKTMVASTRDLKEASHKFIEELLKQALKNSNDQMCGYQKQFASHH